ncbi:LPXTG cell wall anchor domain-containing protein [Pseudomonas oligotrophica]|uniref:LPXTG cell wall anchor domain-containing protein n=1 Tax=Pseudomonas oligotrophica TaxID=2912055 RepID=UPI001F003AE4|nr:LPXTG cell wall anchor domain-containing protein [Pseudomonas oligotrophica]MCF7204112.1 LPXTG cell wall anchor domain-containing protein [Pseudomonas oligotrophica]
MKLSDNFDARRLRPRRPRQPWRRLAQLIAALLGLAGLLLLGSGLAQLAGLAPAGLSGELDDASTWFLAFGLALLLAGLLLGRRCRRRSRGPGELSMAPGLLKKRP